MTKVCFRCKEEKSISEFHKQAARKDGLHSWCKSCARIAAKEYYSGKERAAYLSSKHNMTVEQYDDLLRIQNFRCAVCGSVDPRSNQGNCFQVDHDHLCCSGARSCGLCVRGLLCAPCNIALGAIHDNTDALRAMILYLENQRKVDTVEKQKYLEATKAAKRIISSRKSSESRRGRKLSEEHKEKIRTAQTEFQRKKRETLN